MGLIVVLGEAARVEGFALGGATVIAAEDADAVRRAWASAARRRGGGRAHRRGAPAALGGDGRPGMPACCSVVMPP